MPTPQSVHETHIMPDALMPFIFHTDRTSSKRIVPNWHENIELLCFISGKGYLKCGTERYAVRGGDVAVINPDVLHMTGGDGELIYHCLIVDRTFCEANGIDILSLHFKEIISDPVIFESFCEAVEAIKSARSDKNAAFSVPRARARVLALLLGLCDNYVVSKSSGRDLRSASAARIKTVMTYMRSHLSEPVTLDEIAEHAGVSKYHLSREFKLFTGATIFDSLNIMRCKEARHLLSSGATVSEAAHACGFENLSYFSRTFKKYTGKLPSEYMKDDREKIK